MINTIAARRRAVGFFEVKTLAEFTRLWLNTIILAVGCVFSAQAISQCELLQLANPSFEVGSGPFFSGWQSFGNISDTDVLVSHGLRAAQLSGSNTGDWALSALWQKQTSGEGDQWNAKAKVAHLASDPIDGDASLIINIEWRDSANALISYESFEVLGPDSPTGTFLDANVTSSPAPVGTTSMHLLIGFLQSPAGELGTAVVDSVTLRETTGIQQADQQWGDFPSGRSIDFAGHTWRVKGSGVYGPGPSAFSDQVEEVWVENNGDLHLTVNNRQGTWYSTEIATEAIMGYGDYRLTLKGRLDDWAENIVFGFFHWQYPRCYDGGNPWNLHNELDFELSRWGDINNDNGQFVVQPYYISGNIDRFDLGVTSEQAHTTVAYRWSANEIEFRAWHGGIEDESPTTIIAEWTYEGAYIPTEDLARVHLNFWQLNGPPSNGQNHELVLSDFDFTPLELNVGFAVPAITPLFLGFLVILFIIIMEGIARTIRTRLYE